MVEYIAKSKLHLKFCKICITSYGVFSCLHWIFTATLTACSFNSWCWNLVPCLVKLNSYRSTIALIWFLMVDCKMGYFNSYICWCFWLECGPTTVIRITVLFWAPHFCTPVELNLHICRVNLVPKTEVVESELVSECTQQNHPCHRRSKENKAAKYSCEDYFDWLR